MTGFAFGFRPSSPALSTGGGTSSAGAGGGEGMGAGGWLALGAAIVQGIGAYYSVEAMKDQTEIQARELQHQSTIAGINASMRESEAVFRMWVAKRQAADVGLRYAQIRGEALSSFAARGVQLGGGGRGGGMVERHLASVELAQEVDKINININAVRDANATSLQSLGYRMQGSALRQGAANARASARTMMPWVSALGTAGASFAGFAYQQARAGREQRYYEGY